MIDSVKLRQKLDDNRVHVNIISKRTSGGWMVDPGNCIIALCEHDDFKYQQLAEFRLAPQGRADAEAVCLAVNNYSKFVNENSLLLKALNFLMTEVKELNTEKTEGTIYAEAALSKVLG